MCSWGDKMKTITKTFYVNKSDFDTMGIFSVYKSKTYSSQYEIQISWQEPEKRVEISESDFDLIWNGSDEYTYYDIKKKFFGASDE